MNPKQRRHIKEHTDVQIIKTIHIQNNIHFKLTHLLIKKMHIQLQNVYSKLW